MDTKKRIALCKQYYESRERIPMEKALRYYRGEYIPENVDLSSSDARLFTAHNLVFATAETGVVNLIGSNPTVGFQPRNRLGFERAKMATAYVDWCFRTNRIRRQSALALIDAVLCRRGIFKTVFDFEFDQPKVGVVLPSRFFFDRSVRDPRDMRWFLESTTISKDEYERRVEAGWFPRIDMQRPSSPLWFADAARRGNRQLLELDAGYEIWEHYDLNRGVLQYYLEHPSVLLYEERLDYGHPYDMFVPLPNAVDGGGLSEIELITGHQEKINDMLTLTMATAYRSIPRILYDAGLITEEDLNVLVSSSPASFVGIRAKNRSAGLRLSSLFFPAPQPENPKLAMETVQLLMELAGHTSALAEASRGRIANARTATEVATIESQQLTRFSFRQLNFYEALEGVAAKCMYLGSKYMSGPRYLRLAGAEAYAEVYRHELADIEGDFEINAYNAIRSNPAVMLEAMQGMVQMLAELRANGQIKVDVNAVVHEILRRLNFPPQVFDDPGPVPNQGGAMPGPAGGIGPSVTAPGMDPAQQLQDPTVSGPPPSAEIAANPRAMLAPV